MTYRLDPQIAGQLGPRTSLDTSTHPPVVRELEYVLDTPHADDLIQSFPAFLVTEDLGARIRSARLTGIVLASARVSVSDNYRALYSEASHPRYLWLRIDGTSLSSDVWLDSEFRICTSDRAFKILQQGNLSGCQVTKVSD